MSTPPRLSLRAASLEATHAVAAALAALSRSGDIILLAGEMGAGKTAFAQGFGRALGVTEPITSPTFTLVHSYDTGGPDAAPRRPVPPRPARRGRRPGARRAGRVRRDRARRVGRRRGVDVRRAPRRAPRPPRRRLSTPASSRSPRRPVVGQALVRTGRRHVARSGMTDRVFSASECLVRSPAGHSDAAKRSDAEGVEIRADPRHRDGDRAGQRGARRPRGRDRAVRGRARAAPRRDPGAGDRLRLRARPTSASTSSGSSPSTSGPGCSRGCVSGWRPPRRWRSPCACR